MEILILSVYQDFSFGALTIGAFLEKNGHRVSLRRLVYPDQRNIDSLLKEVRPQIVGLTCYTPQALKVLYTARLIKDHSSCIKVVLGGVHATIFSRKILENFQCVDYVVVGEGEIPFLELLKALEKKTSVSEVANLAFRCSDGRVVEAQRRDPLVDLDRFADLPSKYIRDDIIAKNGSYLEYGLKINMSFKFPRSALLVTSRGCPYSCDYCAGDSITLGKWRAMSSAKTIDLVERIHVAGGFSRFFFQDAVFCTDKKRVLDICYEIKKRGLGIRWAFQTHPLYIDKDIIEQAVSAGCRFMSIGLDCSTSESMLRHRGVRIDYDSFAKIVKFARRSGMGVRIYQIVGWPQERWIETFEAARHIKQIKPSHFYVVGLAYMPGSRLYQEGVQKGHIDDNFWLKKSLDSFPVFGNSHRIRIQKIILVCFYLMSCRSFLGIVHLFATAIERKFSGLSAFFYKKNLIR